jgi:1-acyl-sn-glycerol-3-phosphate acyltransferase
VSKPRIVLRLASVVAFVLFAILVVVLFPVLGRRARERVVGWIFRTVTRAVGARMEIHGRDNLSVRAGALVASNHISWLDIVAVNAARPMRAQGKKEVRDWPVIGMLATRAGTVYVDRENLRVLPAGVAELAEAMRSGSLVNVSPEGTTWCGREAGRFRPAAFQAAIDAGVPVIPVALRYRLSDGRDTAAPAFIGDETLLDSVYRTAKTRGLVVEVHVLKPIDSTVALDRKELAMLTQTAVRNALEAARPKEIRPVPFMHLREKETRPLPR